MRCRCVDPCEQGHNELKMVFKGRGLLDDFTRENGFSLLLCGPPGAGKTTLGLRLFHEIFSSPEYKRSFSTGDKSPRALILSFVETAQQITQLCRSYNLDFSDSEVDAGPLLIQCLFGLGDEPDLEKISAEYGFHLRPGKLLLIDGISVLGTHHDYRSSLLSFTRQTKESGLISILIAEDYGHDKDRFLQYAVDGVIVLACDSHAESRRLEITKLRWHDFHMGPHAFRFYTPGTHSIDRGGTRILFFPSVSCLIDERRQNRLLEGDEKNIRAARKKKGLSSGIPGFEQIVAGKEGTGFAEGDGPFRLGEQALLIGPSGSGKYLFGTQFLAAADEDERAVFISFVHGLREHEERMAACPGTGKNTICDCLFFNPANLVLDEMFGGIHNLLQKHENSVVRLFIEGISALRPLFDAGGRFESFMLSLMQLLDTFPNVATLMSYYTPRVFASYGEIDIPTAERFSTVIGFSFQEQFNRLVPAFVILKSRIPGCDTSLKVPKVKPDGTYWIDLQAGWSRVGLLSGQREQIREEVPFFKLFFENKSEAEVLADPMGDFERRYPGNHIFKMVAKVNPQPDHWSFRGYYGPGHSNTKLIELRKYVMDVLKEKRVFLDVPPSMIREFEQRLKRGFLWNDNAVGDKDTHKMVPFYADVGVLVYQRDILEKMMKDTGVDAFPYPRTWEDILRLVEIFQAWHVHFPAIKHLFTIPNAVTDAKSFISFFFELSWTHGWKYPAREYSGLSPSRRVENAVDELLSWVKGEFFDKSVALLKKMIDHGKRDHAIPNPNQGGHYHQSVLSRRWFSKIHLLPEDARKRATDNQAFWFGIEPLPGVQTRGGVLPGISNVDLYAIGIIGNALAPETGWMLVSNLLDYHVDVDRVKRKRGLPISRRMFQSRLFQDNLGAAPVEPAPGFYSGQDGLFDKYRSVLGAILGLHKISEPKFRRTSDIPRFFQLEQLLVNLLPPLFEDTPRKASEVKKDIVRGIEEIYRKDNKREG